MLIFDVVSLIFALNVINQVTSIMFEEEKPCKRKILDAAVSEPNETSCS